MIAEQLDGVTRLTASEGKFVTDGKGTTGRVVYLGKGRAVSEFFEVDAAAEDVPAASQRLAELEQAVDGILEVLA